jgi:branched-chain amino acid transport system permease protein
MSILGGMFNFVGPSVGAVAFVALREIIKVRTDYWPLVLGVVLLTLVLVLPGGIVGFVVEKARPLISGEKGESQAP